MRPQQIYWEKEVLQRSRLIANFQQSMRWGYNNSRMHAILYGQFTKPRWTRTSTNKEHPIKTKQGKIIRKKFHIKLKSNLCSFETENTQGPALKENSPLSWTWLLVPSGIYLCSFLAVTEEVFHHCLSSYCVFPPLPNVAYHPRIP